MNANTTRSTTTPTTSNAADVYPWGMTEEQIEAAMSDDAADADYAFEQAAMNATPGLRGRL